MKELCRTCTNKEAVRTLLLFNSYVARLKRTSLYKRFTSQIPNVTMKFGNATSRLENDGSISIIGQATSLFDDFVEDEVDAYVNTYRKVRQRNDAGSLWAIRCVYEGNADVPDEAKLRFSEARSEMIDYLGSYTAFMYNEDNISIDELLDCITYGYIAHSEAPKYDKFRRWTSGGVVEGLVWCEYYAALLKLAEYYDFFMRLNNALVIELELNTVRPAIGPG